MTEPIPPAVQGIIDRLALDPRHVQGVEVGQFLPAFPIAPDVGALVDLRDFGTWLGASNLRYRNSL